MEKRCNTCKQTKSVENFATNKLTEDGLRSSCKLCTKIRIYKRTYNLTDEWAISLTNKDSICSECNKTTIRWSIITSLEQNRLICWGCYQAFQFKDELNARLASGIKICSLCKEGKSFLDFPIDVTRPDGYNYVCKPCWNIRAKESHDAIKVKERRIRKQLRNIERDPLFNVKKNMMKRFKLTFERFNEIFASQDFSCKICKTKIRPTNGWPIDHDHACCHDKDRTCGKCIRGILCQDCNQGLGRFKDDPNLLLTAIEYLKNNLTTNKENNSVACCEADGIG